MNYPDFYFIDYTTKDFDDVMKLWVETGLGNPNRGDDNDIILHSIKIGGRMVLMRSKSDNTLLGTSWMTFDGRRVHLHHFGITKKYQGLGLGKELAKFCIKHVKEKGYQVKLEVHKENKAAIELYKKFGFKYLGDYDVYIIREI